MKTRPILLTLALCFVAALAFAANPSIGTWKLNEAKSNFPPGAPKNTSVVYQEAGDKIRVSVDGVDAEGDAAHNEWIGKFDGKDYPVTGNPTMDTRSYKMVNAHTLSMTVKKGVKVVMTGRIVVSADGKTRTVTTSGVDSMGMQVSSTAIYDKQ